MHASCEHTQCASSRSVSDRHAGPLSSIATVVQRQGMAPRWHPVLHRPCAPTFDAKHTGCRIRPTFHVACSPRAEIEASTNAGVAGSSTVSNLHTETPSTSSPAVESRPGKLTRCVTTTLLLVVVVHHPPSGHAHGHAKRQNFMYYALMDCHAAVRPSNVRTRLLAHRDT